MGASNEVEIKISADASEVKTGVEAAAAAIRAATSQMQANFAKLRDDFGKGLKIDTSDFEGMQKRATQVFAQTRTASEQLKEKLAELDRMYKAGAIDVDTYTRATKQTRESMEHAAQSANPLAMGFAALKGAIAGLSILSLGTEAIKTMADFEQLQVALNSVMGSAAEGQKAFAWIKQFAIDTPFEVNQVAQSFRLLKAYGIDPTNGSLRAIADMASYTGKGFEGMQSATLALGQAWTRAKLQGQDILQLVDAGIPVWDILAKATGKNSAELMKLSEKGMLGRDAITALMAGMEKMAGGASAAQMQTLTGKWSNFTDAIKNALDAMRRDGAMDGLKTAMDQLTSIVPAVAATFQAFGEIVGSVFGAIGELWDSLTGSISSGAGQQVTVLNVIKGALEAVRWLVLGLKTAFEITFEVIKASLAVGVANVMRFGNVAKAAFSLDWQGMKSAWKQGTSDIESIVSQSAANIVRIAEKNRDEMLKFSSFYTDQSGPKIDTSAQLSAKSGAALVGGGDAKKGKKAASRMSEWEAELGDAKVYYQQTNDLRQYSKQQEIAYWNEVLAKNKATAEERIAITRKVNQLTLELQKQEKDRRDKLNLEKVDSDKRAALDALAVEEQHAQAMQQSGQITSAELLTLQRNYEDRRYQIEVDAQQQRINLMKGDPNQDPVALQKLLDEMEAIRRKHALDIAKINDQMAAESSKKWQTMLQPISQAFDTSIKGIIMGTTTMQKALSNIFQSILGEFISMGVKMVVRWAATELAKTSATVTSVGVRTAAETAGAATSTAVGGGAAITNIMNSAYEAMAGAYKAIVGIPFVGPVLAPVAAGVAFAGVAGLAGSIASSAGGEWDVPADRMQLVHKRETILPASISDKLRGMVEGGGGMGGEIHLHVNAVDSKDVARLFKDNGHHLAAALKQQVRQFNTGR